MGPVKRIGPVVVLALLVLLAGGCGLRDRDDGPEAAATTSPPGEDAPTPTGGADGPAVDTRTVAPAVEAVGTVEHGSLVTPDGRTRTYRLYRPSERAADAPLVVALHGGTGNGDQFATTSGYEGLAEANGFVVVFPDGTPTAFGPDRMAWNGGGCCAAAARDDVDDVGFLTALVDTLAEEEGIAPDRVLVTGHSNGAIMAFRLACEAADHVAAVAVQAGTVFVDDCAPSRPVAALDLHGSADTHLPVDGGAGPDSLAGADFPPVRDGLAALAGSAGCEGVDRPTVRATDQADVTVESWGPCPDEVAVELVVVAGAGHSWMGHPPPSGRSDEPYADLDASLVTWAFLSQHR